MAVSVELYLHHYLATKEIVSSGVKSELINQPRRGLLVNSICRTTDPSIRKKVSIFFVNKNYLLLIVSSDGHFVTKNETEEHQSCHDRLFVLRYPHNLISQPVHAQIKSE